MVPDLYHNIQELLTCLPMPLGPFFDEEHYNRSDYVINVLLAYCLLWCVSGPENGLNHCVFP